jgi:hypothetical protein
VEILRASGWIFIERTRIRRGWEGDVMPAIPKAVTGVLGAVIFSGAIALVVFASNVSPGATSAIVTTADPSSVGHFVAPRDMRRSCEAFREQVEPNAVLASQSYFSSTEPDFRPLLGGHRPDWLAPPRSAPVVDCELSANNAHDLLGLTVARRGATFAARVYVDRQDGWIPSTANVWTD